eukprot:g20559.t1
MADSSDLVNCHFSVNQQALMSAIKPMMSELAQEWGYESRLSTLEKTQVMLQKEVALKAEAAGHALRLTALLLHYCASLSVKRIEEVSWHPKLHPDFTLASCSHDGSVRLWSVPRVELTAILRPESSESGYIKGVAFDPLGQFLACMSDGKQLAAMLYQSPEENDRGRAGGAGGASGWEEVPINQAPWAKPGQMSAVNFRRPCWDPLGESVVFPFGEHKKSPLSTCRFYSVLFTAPWKTPKLYRGHKKHVAVVRFCPIVFAKVAKGAEELAVVLALGCMDGMLSLEALWLEAIQEDLPGLLSELQAALAKVLDDAAADSLPPETKEAQLRSLESTISWKADQSALEEHVRSVEIACKQGETKADQSSLNRVLASTSKLQGQVSQMEKAVQEIAQRMSEHLSKSRSQFQKLHDILSSKVDVRDLEALANATKDGVDATLISGDGELQTAVALKVGPQPLQEIRSILRDMQLKLDLKVDVPVAEDLQAARGEVDCYDPDRGRVSSPQEFREAASSIHSLRANLDGKVDFALLSELRVKTDSAEDIPDLSGLKEAMNQKAERRQVTELSGMVERLQQELHFSLENDRAAFRRDLEARVEKMDQLERDLQNAMVCVESLTSKVDATPRLADASSPKGTASPTSERGSSPASPRPSGELREVMKALDGKADRSEIQDGVMDVKNMEHFREELLNAAAEAAAESISGSIPDPVPGVAPEGEGSDPLILTQPLESLEAFPAPNLQATASDEVSLKDAPNSEKISLAFQTQRDNSSNSGHTTPRMNSSASAPSSRLLALSGAVPCHTRSGSVGTRGSKKSSTNRVTGLPAYPAKGTKVSGWSQSNSFAAMVKTKASKEAMRWADDGLEGPIERKPGEEGNDFDIRMQDEPDGVLAAQKIVQVLKERGFCLVQANAPPELVQAAFEEAETLWEDGEFKPPIRDVEKSVWIREGDSRAIQLMNALNLGSQRCFGGVVGGDVVMSSFASS